MHLGKTLFQAGAQIKKILKRQVWMQSADDMKFGDCLTVSRRCSLESFVERHGVCAGCVFLAAESAKPARGDAHIRGIDVPVDVEVSLIAMHALPYMVGHPTHSQ